MWRTRHIPRQLHSPTRNADGRARAITLFSLLRPGCAGVQRLVFALGRWPDPGVVRQLSFIHFARLAVIQRFPDHGQPPEDLGHGVQLFETNYNGTFDQYIDTFVDEIPWKMRMFWATSYGFPWRLQHAPFKHYIHASELLIDHYYVAYPEASATMIGAALRVTEAHSQFRRQALTLAPDEFTEHYRAFVTHVQHDL